MSEAPAEAAFQPQVGEPQARVSWALVLLTAIAGLGMMTTGYIMTASSSAPGGMGSAIAQLFHNVGSVHYVLGLIALAASSLLYSSASRTRTWGIVILVVGLASLGFVFLIVAAGAAGALILALPGLLGVVAGYRAARRK